MMNSETSPESNFKPNDDPNEPSETELCRVDPAYFAETKVRLNGQPIEFTTRRILEPIYRDRHAHVVMQKGPQCGGTLWAIVAKVIHGCKYVYELGAAYYLPTASDMRDVVRTKVDPSIKGTPFLKSAEIKLNEDVDNTRLKKIGNCFAYFRGLKGALATLSISVDVVIRDEKNKMKLADIEKVESRTEASKFQHTVDLSNPTFPKFGISEDLERSDKKLQVIKCQACNHECIPEEYFPDCFMETENGVILVCQKCKREINRLTVDWIPMFPSKAKEASGYRLTAFGNPTVNLNKLWTDFKKAKSMQTFYNLRLGMEYLDSTAQVTDEQVLMMCGQTAPQLPANVESTMGVDQGKVLHVVITWPERGGKRGMFMTILEHDKDATGAITRTHWQKLDALVHQYRVRKGVVELEPEMLPAFQFATRHRGRIYLSDYTNEVLKPVWDETKWRVKVDRTVSLDGSHHALNQSRYILPPSDQPFVLEFARHCKNTVKVLQEDEDGNKWSEWAELGPDHFRHAQNMDCLCWDVRDDKPISIGAKRQNARPYVASLRGYDKSQF